MKSKSSFVELNDSIYNYSIKSKFNICKECGKIQRPNSLCDHRESYK